MIELCSTCLSSDRRLTPISSIKEVLAFIKWTDVKWNMNGDKVCWECLALLKKVESFKRQALLAQQKLSMYKNNDKPMISLKSMSTLSSCIINMCGNVEFSPTTLDIKIELEEFENYCEIPPLKIENDEIKEEENNSNQITAPINPNEKELVNDDEEVFLKPEGHNPNDIDEVNNSMFLKPEGHNSNDIEEPNNSKFLEHKEHNSNEIEELINSEDDETTDNSDRYTVVTMTVDEMLEARDLDMERPFYKKSPYKCVTCLTGYFTEDALEKHNTTKHHEKMGPYKCSICEERFNQVDKHSSHYASHFRRYQCAKCEFRHHGLHDIQKHVDTVHVLRNYDCTKCDKSFMTLGQRKYHMNKCHKEKPTCTICGKTYATATNLKIHMAGHGPMQKCPHCGKYYKVLRAHIKKKHSQPDARRDEAYCAECDVQFSSPYSYRTHLKDNSRHRDPTICKYPCDQCDRKFYLKRSFEQHVLVVHNKEYPFGCDYCGKSYHRKYVLEQHILEKHLGISRPKNKICTICGKGFKDKRVLKGHLRIHTGEKPFQCEFCPWRFAQNSTLYTHMRGKHPEAIGIKKKEKTVEKKNEMVKKKKERS